MKKIYKLKQWYSLEDAANRLSLTLGEDISPIDVLGLALEGNIALYWYVRHVAAQEVVFEVKSLKNIAELVGKPMGEDFGITDKIDVSGYYPIEIQPHVSMLEGPYRLMIEINGALADYYRSHLTETGGELLSVDGFYVQDSSDKIWQVLEPFPGSYIDTTSPNKRLHIYDKRRFYPSGEWPNISEIGFTKREIEIFENELQSNEVKAVSSRERQTLNKILIAMATDGYGYDPDAARSPFPKELEGILDRMGLSVSDDTIRAKLKDAAELLPKSIAD